MQQDYDVHIT